MELLLTGWVAALSAPFCRRLTEEHKLVVAAKQIPSVDLGRGVDPFSYGLHEDRFEKLFHSYSFDTVMYFARRPEEEGRAPTICGSSSRCCACARPTT